MVTVTYLPHGFAEDADLSGSLGYVLLNNGNVVRGNAQQVHDRVIIRDGDQSEMVVNFRQVACWARDLESLYQYRVDHRRGGGLKERLDDVRWCFRQGLLKQAAGELADLERLGVASPQLDPLRERLIYLRQAATQAASRQVQSDQPSPGDSPVRQASFTDSRGPMKEVSLGDDVDLAFFTQRVQPLLINRCGSCHGTAGDRDWRLIVPGGNARPSARETRRNWLATIPWIENDSVGPGDFWTMATTVHGGMRQTPIGPSDPQALKNLQTWLATTAGMSETATASVEASRFGETPADAEVPPEANDSDPPRGVDEAEGLPPRDRPARLPVVSDPFDPERFNRRFHR